MDKLTLKSQIITTIAAVFVTLTAPAAGDVAAGPSDKSALATKPVPQFKLLPYGAIRPEGWIKAQIEQDVRHGLFAYYHRNWQVRNRAFELPGHNPDKVNKQSHHWDGGAESYWGLALIANSILASDAAARQRADAFVAVILKSQDSDGYIGICDQEKRYRPDTIDLMGVNGFLLQGLLYYAQAYDRKDVIEAIERAVRCDMRHFNRNTKDLWVKFTVLSYPQFLDMLAQATGKTEYADYAAFLVENYSAAPDTPVYFTDCTLTNLLNKDRRFIGHGCNTTGDLSLPWLNYYITGNPQYRQAGENAFAKFERQMSVSGSLPGDEDNQGREPLPEIGIEFCTTTYLVESALLVGDKTGASRFFDLAERALFNAGMGARLPDGTAHAYLKRDSEFNLNYPGIFHRYRYSPAHEPFCCSTRMMSVMPVFVANMFKRTADEKGLAAVCFGPATVRTKINGSKVEVEEKTLYPFEGKIEFHLRAKKPVTFEFMVRVPTWTPAAEVKCAGAEISRRRDFYVVKKEWRDDDAIDVTFETPVQAIRWVNSEYALKSGPLVFAARINATPVKYDKFPSGYTIQDLSDGKQPIYGFEPGRNSSACAASLDGLAERTTYGFKRVVVSVKHPDQPWQESPVRLEGMMNRMRSKFKVALVPMGRWAARCSAG